MPAETGSGRARLQSRFHKFLRSFRRKQPKQDKSQDEEYARRAPPPPPPPLEVAHAQQDGHGNNTYRSYQGDVDHDAALATATIIGNHGYSDTPCSSHSYDTCLAERGLDGYGSFSREVAYMRKRHGKDKSSMSRMKKLKRRISASFGRLSISKEDCIQERAADGSRHVTVNGHSHSSRDPSQSPPVFYSLNGTPDHKPIPHPLRGMGHSLDESYPAPLPPHHPHTPQHPTAHMGAAHPHHSNNSHRSNGHHDSDYSLGGNPSQQRSRDSDYPGHHGSHPGELGGYQTGSQGVNHRPPPVPPHQYDPYAYGEPHPAALAVQNLKRTPVKRHHSTGDMLGGEIDFPSPPRHHKPRRPKSEGHFYVEAFRPKRASSFGYNSPFGKAEAYEKREQLGEGSYATVFKGISLLTNKVVALKEIRLQQEEGTPFTAIREASLLKGLKHANIVTLHDIIHTKDTLTFVFEFVNTDLSQYLEKRRGGLNPRNVKLFLFQLLRGLAFCHQRRILHRDLKPQNLLISEIGELKLADFGLARAKSVPSHTYSHEVVTLWYRPPDVLLGSTDYSTPLDIWGIGCIFTEMVSGDATFPGMKDAWDQLDRIWRVLGTPSEDVWEGVTSYPNYNIEKFGRYVPQKLSTVIPKLAHIPHAEVLAQELLQLIPRKRISAKDALLHRYFSDLPKKIYDLPNAASIFDIPGVRLAPEVDELLRTHIRTNPHVKTKV